MPAAQYYMRIAIAGLLLTLFSCRTPRYVYAPGQVNAPLLQSKGEWQGNALLGTGPAADFSLAWSPLSHLGVLANAGFTWDHYSGSGNNGYELLSPYRINYSRRYWDLALGAYTPLAKSLHWSAEIYLGLGRGYLGIADSGTRQEADSVLNYSRNFSSRIPRFYLQPAIGYNGPHSQLAIYCRLLFQHFNQVHSSYTADEMEYYRIPRPGAHNPLPVLEGGMSSRFYLQQVPGLGIEINMLVVMGTYREYDIIPIKLSAGLRYRLRQ